MMKSNYTFRRFGFPVAFVALVAIVGSMLVASFSTAGASPYYLNSLRAQGMGNAFVAVADDRYAPFYNPAGLSFLRDKRTFTLLDGSYGEVGNLVNDLYSDYSRAKPLIDAEDEIQQAEDAMAILEAPSTYRYYRINLMPAAYTRKNFAIGLYDVINAYAIYGGDFVDTDVFDGENISSFEDIADLLNFDPADVPLGVAYTEVGSGLYLAMAKDHEIGLGSFSYGGNLRTGYRFNGLGSINLDTQLKTVRADTAVTAVADLGLMYALDASSKTTYKVGLSYNNLFLVEGLAQQQSGTRPFPYNSYLTPTVLNFGGAMIIPFGEEGSASRVTVAMDLPDVLDSRKVSDYRVGMGAVNMFNYGVEADIGRHFALRTGMNEGYGTLGLGVKIPAIRLDYAYYVETPPAPVTINTGIGDNTLTLFSRRGAIRKHSVNVGFDF